MATPHTPTLAQLKREFLEESAAHSLRTGQVFSALTLPFLAWYFYQDHALGFGMEIMVWRCVAVTTSLLFLLGSWTVLPRRPRLTLVSHGLALAGPVINSAGLTITLFHLRPEVYGFQAGARGALFITTFAAFAFGGGVRKYLWAITGIPVIGMAIALLLFCDLSGTEWSLFTDILIAVVVVAVVGVQQARLSAEEFRMRRWANHRKAALELRLRELRQLNRQLREFAYLVSHDLKEPLHTMNGFLGLAAENLAADTPDLERVTEFVDQAQAGAERMSRLMEGLLIFSRLDSTEEAFQRVDLEAVLDEALANLGGRIRDSNARIHRSAVPAVRGNQGQLLQLFQNLLSNALKYHAPGEPPDVSISSSEQAEQTVVVIKDHGIGIDPKQHDRVFRLFQRLHTQQEYEGTGVGLAVVRRIAERHGGEVVLESAPGEGATFRVTLLKA